MQHLKNNDIYIVVHGDKNLGPCILERNFYIFKGFAEHLGNTRNYKELSERQALGHQRGLQYCFRGWLSKYRLRSTWDEPVDYVCISAVEITFLSRALKFYSDKIARF